MKCAVIAFPDSVGPAARLAAALGVPCRSLEVRQFPDGESLVRAPEAPPIALVYRSLDRPNQKLVELLLAVSALRENGSRRVVLVLPYLAYMRQDAAFRVGEAVSQRVVGALLSGCCDALLTVDPHLHRTASLDLIMPGIEACAVSAAPVLAAALAGIDDPLVVAPDGEARQWVEAIAAPLGLDVLLGEKRRCGDRAVDLAIPQAARAAGRSVVLVDDLVSSGTTLVAAARQLRAAGAAQIEALVTHCLARPRDVGRLRRAGIAALRATDTVANPLGTLPVADLLAEQVRIRRWLE